MIEVDLIDLDLPPVLNWHSYRIGRIIRYFFALDVSIVLATLNLYICVFLAAEHEYHIYFRRKRLYIYRLEDRSEYRKHAMDCSRHLDLAYETQLSFKNYRLGAHGEGPLRHMFS